MLVTSVVVKTNKYILVKPIVVLTLQNKKFKMLLLVIILPLIGSMLAGLFSNVIGRKGAALLTTTFMFLNVILTFYIFYKTSVCDYLYFVKLKT